MVNHEKPIDADPQVVALDAGEQDITKSLDFLPSAAQDEAVKVLNNEHGSDEWDAREERSLLWKIDRKLFSLVLIS